ncbi:hypothetical protein M2407_005140 [Serratia sp. BIGb0234]|nr:hypothetical protein [Serratia sp. BIGb0234]
MFRRWGLFIIIVSLPLVGSLVLLSSARVLCGYEFIKIGIFKNFPEVNYFEVNHSAQQVPLLVSLAWEHSSI